MHWAVEFLNLYPDDFSTRLRSAQVVESKLEDPAEFVLFHNGQTGEVIKEIPLGPARRFSHCKIRALLAKNIDIQVGLGTLLQGCLLTLRPFCCR